MQKKQNNLAENMWKKISENVQQINNMETEWQKRKEIPEANIHLDSLRKKNK